MTPQTAALLTGLIQVLQLIFGPLAAGCGFKAARLWLNASTVKTKVGMLEATLNDHVESGDDVVRLQMAQGLSDERLQGTIDSAVESASLNRSAATWTARSVIFGVPLPVLGALSAVLNWFTAHQS